MKWLDWIRIALFYDILAIEQGVKIKTDLFLVADGAFSQNGHLGHGLLLKSLQGVTLWAQKFAHEVELKSQYIQSNGYKGTIERLISLHAFSFDASLIGLACSLRWRKIL